MDAGIRLISGQRGREFLDSLPQAPADPVKVAGGNAAALLRLP